MRLDPEQVTEPEVAVDWRRDDDADHGQHCDELILQGLKILVGLASDPNNCIDICSAADILPKIMAPLQSATLIQDAEASEIWAGVVTGSFKVLCRLLLCAPEEIRTRLRRDISASTQALANLQSIVDHSSEPGHQELQILAMDILVELAMDLSLNLSRETNENLINKLLDIFLDDVDVDVDDDGGDDDDDGGGGGDDDDDAGGQGTEGTKEMPIQLKTNAGLGLALLSTNSVPNSTIIVRAYGDTVRCLHEMLDAENNIKHRTVAAMILENLYTHCALVKGPANGILLPLLKVTVQICSS